MPQGIWFWTSDKDNILITMYADGEAKSKIAVRLGTTIAAVENRLSIVRKRLGEEKVPKRGTHGEVLEPSRGYTTSTNDSVDIERWVDRERKKVTLPVSGAAFPATRERLMAGR